MREAAAPQNCVFFTPLFHFFCCIFARHVQTKCILKTEISPGLHLFSPQWRLKLFASTQGGLPPPTQLTNTGRPGKTVFLQNLHLITEVCVQKISQVQIQSHENKSQLSRAISYSISWFQVVTERLTGTFRQAHLRTLFVCFDEKPFQYTQRTFASISNMYSA